MKYIFSKKTNNFFLSLLIFEVLLVLLLSFLYTQQTRAQSINNNISSVDNKFVTSETRPQIIWDVYTDNKFGFSIEYPHAWQIQEKQNRFMNGPDLSIDSNESILDSNYGRFTFAYIEKAPFNDITVLTNVAIKETVGGFDVDYDKRLIENTNTSKYKIGGEKAGAFTYVLKKKDYSGESTSNIIGTATEVVNTIHKSHVYLFQFLANGENFDNPTLTEIRQHMYNSIKWIR